LVSVDESGMVVYVNQTAEDLLGIDAQQFQNATLNSLTESLEERMPKISEAVGFPFNESVISSPDRPVYFNFTLLQPASGSENIRVCVLPLSLEQDFYLLMFAPVQENGGAGEEVEPDSLPQLINEINRNAERTQVLSGYLSRITPEDLQNHRHLFQDLE